MEKLKVFIKTTYHKYEDIILYVFFGGLTTVVSFVTHFGSEYVFHIGTNVAVVISWICAVTFAFFTNKKWVFKSKTTTKKAFIYEFFSFYAARLFSLGVESVIMFIFVEKLLYNEFLWKVIANVVVLILNYVFSKLIVFRKKK